MVVPISIVITTYNRSHYLSAAIESVLSQTRGDFELLVWDDGSTDDSVGIAQEYAKQDNRVRVVAAEHQGRVLALKAAIAQTTGTYFAYVDSDDLLSPTTLRETAVILDAHPEVGFVYTDYLVMEESGKIRGYGTRCHIPYSKEKLLEQFITFQFRLIRRAVFDRVGGVDESIPYAEDYDLCLRLSEVTEVRHVNQPLYYYRNHLENISHQNREEQIRDAQLARARAIARRSVTNSQPPHPPTWRNTTTIPNVCGSPTMLAVRGIRQALVTLSLAGAISFGQVQAQTITPATDGTGTVVTPIGNQYDITDGQKAGSNLFHSFTQFDLPQGQTANFISNPSIVNILGRVTGGNASIINGLIQITGGNSNLFLMNPAGIIFGSSASLNVPAAFTATTANGIGIGDQWFNAAGANNFTALGGTPSTFAFSTSQPSAIVNTGQLAVGQGQNLILLGGTVASTGELQAPGGQIAVASVPGSSLVRLSQAGYLLSLEIQPLATASSQPQNSTVPGLSLPALLTGSGVGSATGLTVNGNGQVELTGSGLQVADGDVVVQKVTAQTATLQATRNLTLKESQLHTTGDLNLFAQDTVRVRDSVANPFIASAGGRLYLQGNQNVDIYAFNHPASGFFSGGDMVFRSANTVGGDAHYSAGGNFRIETLDGSLGNLFSPYDPIIRASGDVNFGNYTGASLHIFAGGSVSIGNITITGTDLANSINGDNITLTGTTTQVAINGGTQPTLDIRAGTTAFNPVGNIGAPLPVGLTTSATPTSANISIGSITINTANGLVFLTNQNSPNPSLLGGTIQVGAIDTSNTGTNLIFGNSGAVIVDSRGSLAIASINSSVTNFYGNDGGPVTLNAVGDITVTGTINSSSSQRNGGAVTLRSSGGNLNTGAINSSSVPNAAFTTVTGGAVNLTAPGNITVTGNIDSFFNGFSGNDDPNYLGFAGGAVTINTTGGNILTTGAINSSARSTNNVTATGPARGGAVTSTATVGNITIAGAIDSSALVPTPTATIITGPRDAFGGAVTLNAGGRITTNNITSSATDPILARAGQIGLTAGNVITTGAINSSAFVNPPANFNNVVNASGGLVSLIAQDNIVFNTINTQAQGGGGLNGPRTGGSVTISARGVVRGQNTLTGIDFGSTIATTGVTQGGTVSIQHNGGPDNFRFILGDATNNGLAGTINTGGTPLPLQTIPDIDTLIPANNTVNFANGVSITFINQAPTLTANSQLADTTPNQPITFRLSDLNAQSNDLNPDGTIDNFFIRLDSITGTLTRGGVVLNPGDTVASSDVLVYTPPVGFTGSLSNAFSLRASDRVSFSPPVPIGINVTPTPTPSPSPLERPPEKSPITSGSVVGGRPGCINSGASFLDGGFTRKFEKYLGTEADPKTQRDPCQVLADIEKDTGVKPAMMYVSFVPEVTTSTGSIDQSDRNSDQLELLLITAKELPIRKRISGTRRDQVLKMAQEFRSQVTDSRNRRGYIKSSEQLYKWLVAPLQADLQARKVQNLVFLMDTGLRSIPIAALYDGKQFIIERYSVGLMPSISLTDTRYRDIKKAQVLAMGAEKFTELNPLPAVPVEISTIAGKLWQGKYFLDNAFTLNNLKLQREKQPFGIIHLATHGEFRPGNPTNSYIQLSNTKLHLNELRKLGWNNPPVELLVLSACRTALGDEEAELGFAGLSVLAGVKSSLASLWYVSDQGTLGLMTTFYEDLKTAPIKSEALRQAQLAMLKGQVRLDEGKLITPRAEVPLPPELVQLGTQQLEHPYYWSAFTMIGNPW